MRGLDNFDQEEETTTKDTSDASVSYIEVSEEDHPAAYEVLKGGSTIRSFFRGKAYSTDDFYADFTEALGAYFENGKDKVEILKWIAPSGEDLARYAEDLEGVEVTVEEDDED